MMLVHEFHVFKLRIEMNVYDPRGFSKVAFLASALVALKLRGL